MQTEAPAPAKAREIARPIPFAPPVTTICLPPKSMVIRYSQFSQTSRRSFLAAAPVLLANASYAAGAGNSIHLGGPIFLKSEDPDALAAEHKRLGYSAAYCPEVKLSDTSRIKAIANAFAKQNIIISEVGAWKNILDPDSTKRRENLAYVTERCALADEVGARCWRVDIAGSYNPTVWYGPNPKNLSKEFFDATVENCRHVIDSVKPKRTKFTIEMMGWRFPTARFIRATHSRSRPPRVRCPSRRL